MMHFTVLVALMTLAAADESYRICVHAAGKTLLFRPDGTGRVEVPTNAARLPGQLSPDRTAVLRGRDGTIEVADAEGKNPRKVSPENVTSDRPVWSPDGRRIAFVGRRGQVPPWQIYVMDRDGRNIRQVTDAPQGAWLPNFAPDGRLAYLRWQQRYNKLPPADLLILDGPVEKAVAKNVFIEDYAWSPDGKTIAYSTLGTLAFHDLATGTEQQIVFTGIDKRLASHAAHGICWRPDGGAVACRIQFVGGRRVGTTIFGDDELFVIPRRGPATWFQPGAAVERIEWVQQSVPAK